MNQDRFGKLETGFTWSGQVEVMGRDVSWPGTIRKRGKSKTYLPLEGQEMGKAVSSGEKELDLTWSVNQRLGSLWFWATTGSYLTR